jgi:K+-sensing histidine kinase KdpD
MRNTPGVGLGLNLVAAIVKLHGFRLVIHPGPGGRVEIVCRDRSAKNSDQRNSYVPVNPEGQFQPG